MEERVVMQWDKDSVEDAGLIKIDLLSLRTLGLISEACSTSKRSKATLLIWTPSRWMTQPSTKCWHKPTRLAPFRSKAEPNSRCYPVSNRPALKISPSKWRLSGPVPIQGGTVHPYLRRRAGLEAVSYPHPSLEPVLKETLGVLLFQEQAIRVAVAAAGFSPGEADLLRRALWRKNSAEAMQQMEQRFLLGAAGQGIDESTARIIFQQLAGFAGYGFPKSHAASFALIAYQTLWLKCYHPAAFYCSLFNAQPMGFYSTEVIAGDAKRHGVALLPPDIHRSAWRSSIERTDAGTLAVRMGLSTVVGLGEEGWQRIEQAKKGNFTIKTCRAHQTARDVVTNLIRSGTMAGLGERRSLLWQLGEIDDLPNPLGVNPPAIPVTLPALAPLEQTLWEQELLGLSPTRSSWVTTASNCANRVRSPSGRSKNNLLANGCALVAWLSCVSARQPRMGFSLCRSKILRGCLTLL